MRLFLGIDGGQSSTVALIAGEDGRVVGSGKSGPCYEVSALADCVVRACASAEFDLQTIRFRAVCAGLSGGPGDRVEQIQRLVRTDHLSVVTDGEIALTGAFSGEAGSIVIAGTGSICFSRNAAGELARSGGWGYIFGDEGGAFDIVRQATRAALRYEEGWGPKTELYELLLSATDHPNANAVLHTFYSDAWPRSRVAKLAVLVDAAAGNGDSVALAILNQAAQSLSVLASTVHEPTLSVSYTGGVFRSALVLERFRQLIELSGLRCVEPELTPAAGALLQAFRLAGIEVKPFEIPDMK